jgi:signal transduction histidine kinase
MDRTPLQRFNTILFYPIAYAVWLAVTVRGIELNFSEGHVLRWLVVGLFVVYGVLLGTERWVTNRLSVYAYLYLFIQSVVVAALAILSAPMDFYAALFLPLSGQAMLLFPRRTGYSWVAFFSVLMVATLIYQFGVRTALPLLFLYGAGYIFIATYANVTQEADTARQESEGLLSELQVAHEQLQDYASRVEELAILKERNRLAREIHDSITQALYGVTLETETAIRQIRSGEQALALDHMLEAQKDGQQALREMRLLIYELRPPILEKEGLVSAIQARIESVEGRAGLEVEFNHTGNVDLPSDVETGLFRIVQEALTNVLKHAQAEEVSVHLLMEEEGVVLEIKDDGTGFDLPTLGTSDGGGLGLTSMQERASEIGAILEVTASPGRGTRIKVELRR